MRSILNKTAKALKVPLPGGRSLFLGPGGRGQVSPAALERPAFKKLVDAGELEVLPDEPRAYTDAGQPARSLRANPGHPASRSTQHKGER